MSNQSRPPVQDRQLYLYLQGLASRIQTTTTQASDSSVAVTALRNELQAEITSLKQRVAALEAAVEQIDSGSGEVDAESILVAAGATQTAVSVSELAEAPFLSVPAGALDELSSAPLPAGMVHLSELILAPHPE